MKYVILIHSDPQPWGHPTSHYLDHVAEYQQMSAEDRQRSDADFEAMLTEMSGNGELEYAQALGAPADAALLRWSGGQPVATDGPYAETKEHLAGFFVIDVADHDRAMAVASRFAGPGETIELRPLA